MKAILVIDMPTDCTKCQFCGFGGINMELNVCSLTGRKGTQPKLDSCPLRPLPQIKYINLDDTHDDLIFEMGWNGCLDEIIGETE